MNISQRQKWIIFVIIGLLLGSISYFNHRKENGIIYELSGKEEGNSIELDKVVEVTDFTKEKIVEKEEVKIMVHVEGEVVSPGLYKLSENSRVFDAVELAGGLTEKADRKQINLAMKIEDEEKIYIPAKGEVAEVNLPQQNNNVQENKSTSTRNTTVGSGKININQASLKELTKLNGIGDALAERIVEYRQQQGSFKSIEEIKKVSGIGDKKFEQIKGYISIN